MKVEMISRDESELEDFDYRDEVVIKVDGKTVFQAADGEPEDGNLSRDFSAIYGIVDLMKMAYDAGKKDEEFEQV